MTNNSGVRSLKTVYGAVVYARVDELERALTLGRLVPLCDRTGAPKNRKGKTVHVAAGNLLTDADREIVRYRFGFPDGTRAQGYWYGDDMKDGLPSYLAS